MQNIKMHDKQNQLVLIDCSAPDFDDTVCKANNISQASMMNRLHARDANGRWLVGVEAFVIIYQTVGMAIIAKLWGSPITRPWAERLYPWVVRHRYILSKVGLPKLFDLGNRHAARKAENRNRLCSEGRCSINK